MDLLFDGFSPTGLFGDGMNLYQYLGSNPISGLDPSGLDVWDDFDEAIAAVVEDHVNAGLVLYQALTRASEGVRQTNLYMQAAFEWMDFIWDQNEAALYGIIAGPFFSSICFVEGTEVLTPFGPEPIECLPLGSEVVSRADPESGNEFVDGAVGGEALRLIRMRYRHADGTTTTMEFLRPAELVACLGLDAGRCLNVVLPKMGVAGFAEVLSIEPYDDIIRTDVPLVTGRFVTDAAEVVDVYLEGYEHPIRVTPQHPIYSRDRQTWVPSGDLRRGECLETAAGECAVVDHVEPRPERATVYNVEIGRYHTYFVGAAGVWAHNPCQLSGEAQQLFKQWKNASQLQGRSLAAFRLGADMKLGSSHFDIIRSFSSTSFSAWEHGYVSWVNGKWLFRIKY
jgi:hypothetical protein